MIIRCLYDKLVPIHELKSHPKNRNQHPKDQLRRLAEILEYQGWRYPIKVSKLSGFVTSGHGRIEAAQLNHWTEVPVNYQEYESEAQEYADVQADNAIAFWSEFNLDLIQQDLKELTDVKIEMLGIRDFELEPEALEPGCDEDDIPEKVDAKTKGGDLYQLGNHRLMCGDSTSIDQVESLLGRSKTDLIFTDPPYNMAFNGRSGKFEVIKNDDLSPDDFETFISEVCQTILSIQPDCYYVWSNWKFFGTLQKYLPFNTCIVWAKNVFGLGTGYRHQHEFSLFRGKIDPHIKNESDLWQVSKDTNYIHPTQKPVTLAERALKNHENAKNILDLFGGSGSTLIACEKLKRNCFMMEADPHYCDLIISRWEKYSKRKANLLNG